MLITIDIIKLFNPCKDGIDRFEAKYPNYSNTLVNLLQLEDVSYNDKIWLVTKVVNIKILQQWSVECAEQVVDNYNSVYPDDNRVSNCIEVIKKYLNGECSRDELLAAVRAARAAAWSAAAAAARSAAWSAAWSAARSAVWSAESAGLAAASAESAGLAAARSAESAEAAAAAEAAWSAARSAESAEAAAEKEQEDINLSILIALLENEGE